MTQATANTFVLGSSDFITLDNVKWYVRVPPHLTTACTRPRIARLLSARLGSSRVVCAAGDAGR